ncbi:PREDICTED: putative nuclease HARBI1 [Trachymyrmex cornetzi]|uniref:putative nuclease HARBI1 n=1 Tax=Trachymyrmex cornetzi TaxID=471704 RepID=UPI00084F3EB5|nr:PREDICTED: putative nuclease HARBI1 [Trachymyrmex cornetzi]XP_018368339.1 PREDICTED: putative nuclease HARBI1 [Trachymyrmex cornetzi]XP_018370060.1 PREDICTED: putative nuclease HARBI1 [Trachymyrmex cornetzi]XP_018374682.1 PREDICTED: putative nuclease HARBI1 [Trachymyrmex cornetzi]
MSMWKRKAIFCMIETTTQLSSSSSSASTYCEVDSTTTDDSLYEDDGDSTLYFPLMRYLFSGRKRYRVEQYLEIVESWTEQEFKEHMRLPRQIVFLLIAEFETSVFMPNHLYGSKPISAKLSIFIFLWFMANTEPIRTISDRFDISISSVFRIIRRVIAWILTKLDDVIKWPQQHNISTVCARFFIKKGIRRVLGTIDCTHIRIQKPLVNEIPYCNRKKFFSIHLQAVVDSDMRFTNVYCGEPGSLHDARVLRRSTLYEIANEDKEILFPNNTFVLGDSAYPLLSWLVPPFRDNGHLTPQQTEFNSLHSSTRMASEKAFGILKARFRRIKFFSEYRNMEFITNIVIAACILHNLCIDENDNFQINEENYDHVIMNENINDVRIDRRMQLFNELFPEV